MKIHIYCLNKFFNVSLIVMYGWAWILCINFRRNCFLQTSYFGYNFLIKHFRILCLCNIFSYFSWRIDILLKFAWKMNPTLYNYCMSFFLEDYYKYLSHLKLFWIMKHIQWLNNDYKWLLFVSYFEIFVKALV